MIKFLLISQDFIFIIFDSVFNVYLQCKKEFLPYIYIYKLNILPTYHKTLAPYSFPFFIHIVLFNSMNILTKYIDLNNIFIIECTMKVLKNKSFNLPVNQV